MILVLGGTYESRIVADYLVKKGYDVTVSTVTEYGSSLYRGGHTHVGALNKDDMEKYIRDNGINVVVDATHPYAVNVSRNAMEACTDTGIKYIRYERESVQWNYGGIIEVKGYREAADMCLNYQRIFLTIGSNGLEYFTGLLKAGKELVARVLPMSSIIKKCEDMGLKPDNIIAIKGPVGYELNLSMFKEYRADVIVTKDSGKVGGVAEKIKAAEELGIDVIMIEKPPLSYPVVVKDLEQLMKEMGKGL